MHAYSAAPSGVGTEMSLATFPVAIVCPPGIRHEGDAVAPAVMTVTAKTEKIAARTCFKGADPGKCALAGSEGIPKGYSMYEVLCERCWNTEVVESDEQSAKPDHACPDCGATDSWVGPFASAERIKRPSDSWPVLTSPHYVHAGQPDRRLRPR